MHCVKVHVRYLISWWVLVCFSFFITLFCLVPCGRLSWLFVSFWVHVNIAHRIVVSYRRRRTAMTARQLGRHLAAGGLVSIRSSRQQTLRCVYTYSIGTRTSVGLWRLRRTDGGKWTVTCNFAASTHRHQSRKIFTGSSAYGMLRTPKHRALYLRASINRIIWSTVAGRLTLSRRSERPNLISSSSSRYLRLKSTGQIRGIVEGQRSPQGRRWKRRGTCLLRFQ